MSISFTQQNILDITRRQIRIPQENAAYASTSANLTAQQTQLLNVDSANGMFYSNYDISARAYESEIQQINGVVSGTFTNGAISPYVAGDLSTSAQFPGSLSATFYPPGYIYNIPQPTNSVSHTSALGYYNPYPSTPNVLCEETLIPGISTMISDLPFPAFGATQPTTTTPINPGPVTGLVLDIAATSGFSSGNLVTVTNGSISGVYSITSIVPDTSITVNSVIPISTQITTGTTTVDNTATTLNPALLVNMTLWQTFLNTQISALAVQNDDRPTQQAQNTTATTNANTALTVVNAWISTPDYTNPFSTINTNVQAQITARTSFLSGPTGRAEQIATALGNVTFPTPNTYTYTISSGDIYYQRYMWLDNRIDLAFGSARRYFAANQGINFIGTLMSSNASIQINYDAYFKTKAITFIGPTPTIQVTDVTGLNAGDQVTVLSETQPPILRAIIAIKGTTQLQLDSPIPNTYLTNSTDIARLYKSLQ